jgi:hypothetical protein
MNLYQKYENTLYDVANTLVVEKYTEDNSYMICVFYFKGSTLTINMSEGGQYKVQELGTNDVVLSKVVVLDKYTNKTTTYENVTSEMLIVNYGVINIKLVKENDKYKFINNI